MIQQNKIYEKIVYGFMDTKKSLGFKARLRGKRFAFLKTYYWHDRTTYSYGCFDIVSPETADYWVMSESGEIFPLKIFGNSSCLACVESLFAAFGEKTRISYRGANFSNWKKTWTRRANNGSL